MSLNDKSNEELDRLLTQYNIKHGPVVDSTRHLYETKLEKAMKNTEVKASSDKTYYREEEEEVTYATYRSAAKHEGSADTLKQRVRGTDLDTDNKWELDTEVRHRSYRTTNHMRVRSRDPINKKFGRRTWKVLLLLLLLAALAAVLYYTYGPATSIGDKLFGFL